MFSKKKTNKRLLILGLDGVPIDLLVFLMERGYLPNLKELFDRIPPVRMSVSLPEISPVCWSTFMTGADPGFHGIYGFSELDRRRYNTVFNDYRSIQVDPFFIDISKRGKQSLIINLPFTYPAPEISGVLVSGFNAMDLERAVTPRRLIHLLRHIGYKLEVDINLVGKDTEMFFADLHYVLKSREHLADLLWNRIPWDLFMLTLTGTDRLHHFFYSARADESHPYHRNFIEFYRDVDRVAGKFIDRLSSEGGEFEWIVLSDHGFEQLENEVYLNPLLKRHGFFQQQPSPILDLSALTRETKAFALDPSRIYVHREDRYARGAVSPGEYELVRSELRQLFKHVTVNGNPLCREVFFKEEIYSLPCLESAPDLVLLPHPGVALKSGLAEAECSGGGRFSGTHRWDNAIFCSSLLQYNQRQTMDLVEVRDIICATLDI